MLAEEPVDSDLLKPLVALGGVLVVGFVIILLALPAPTAPAEEPDAQYTGVGEGYYADITVEVGITDGRIVTIEVTEHEDTRGLADDAIEETINRILEAQSTDVDTVSGATGTSRGVIEGVREALDAAGL